MSTGSPNIENHASNKGQQGIFNGCVFINLGAPGDSALDIIEAANEASKEVRRLRQEEAAPQGQAQRGHDEPEMLDQAVPDAPAQIRARALLEQLKLQVSAQGSHDEAAQVANATLAALEEIHERSPDWYRDMGTARYLEAKIYKAACRFPQALESAERSIAACITVTETESSDPAADHAAVAQAYVLKADILKTPDQSVRILRGFGHYAARKERVSVLQDAAMAQTAAAAADAERYEAGLVALTMNLGLALSDAGEPRHAKQAINKAIEKRNRLAERFPDRYGGEQLDKDLRIARTVQNSVGIFGGIDAILKEAEWRLRASFGGDPKQ